MSSLVAILGIQLTTGRGKTVWFLQQLKDKSTMVSSNSGISMHILSCLALLLKTARPSYIVILYVIPITNICLWVALNVNHLLLLSIRVIVCLSPSCGRLLCLQSIYISVMGCKCISSPWATIIYIICYLFPLS